MRGLVLSLFPGIDILGRAFDAEGFCVVVGPDLIAGRDVRDFHVPPGRFDGVIGGPPCKGESALAHLNGNPGWTLAPEFHRIVAEAQPSWWVMEAVVRHEAPHVVKLSPRWLGEKQSRKRYFHSNLDLEPHVEVALFEHPVFKHAVLAAHGGKRGTIQKSVNGSGAGIASYSTEEMLELQGIPGFEKPPFWTVQGFREAIGNGVPLPMGRAIAKAVVKATTGGSLKPMTRTTYAETDQQRPNPEFPPVGEGA